MGELNIRGSVLYGPGVWGLSAPVAGARVVLLQNSLGNSEPRSIWEGATGANGEFSGTTREWRRQVKVKVGLLEKEVSDPADVLALTIRVELGGQSSVRPFVYVADFVPSPPVIVGWTPSNAVIARVNGRDCYTLAEVASQCAELMRTPRAVEIEVAVQSLLADSRNQEQKIDRLIDWWLSDLTQRLKPPPGQPSLLLTTLQTYERNASRERREARAQAGAQLQFGTQRGQKLSQSVSESPVLLTTLTVICIVLEVVVLVTAGPEPALVVAVLIALVKAVAITGSVSVPALVRAVLGVFFGCSGASVDLAVDTTVAVVSMVLAVALVFMLVGGQSFEWIKTAVLNGRRGWKFRFS